jgi:hypothetical protein
MFDKDSFWEKIKQFFTGDKKIVAYISSALILMTCTAFFVFIVQKTKKTAEPVRNSERKLVADQKLLIPDGPEVQKGYITSRQTKDKWNDADKARWLTLPSRKELDDLGRANDQIVLDITGAAP